MPTLPRLTPRLVVDRPDEAIAFYQTAFGARLIERFADPHGAVVHAALDLGGPILALTQADPVSHNHAAPALGGSPVILTLEVDDVDAVVAAFLEAGGETVFPLDDRFYGKRDGRFRDPFGHLWMLATPIEDLSAEEIELRMAGGG
jgi:uncharacterized glyoxalase superfamily protein PhnB